MKWIAKIFLIFLCSLLILFALLQTEVSGKFFGALISRQLSAQTEREFLVEKAYFHFPNKISLEKIQVLKDKKTQLSINEANISISFLSLIQNKISLRVKGHGFSKLPKADIDLKLYGKWNSWKNVLSKKAKGSSLQGRLKCKIPYSSKKEWNIRSVFSINDEQTLHMKKFQAKSPYLILKGEGSLSRNLEISDCVVSASLPSIKEFAARGKATGSIFSPKLESIFSLQPSEETPNASPSGEGTLSAEFSAQSILGKLSLQANINGLLSKFETDFSLDSQKLLFSNASFLSSYAETKCELALRLFEGKIKGSLSGLIRFPSIELTRKLSANFLSEGSFYSPICRLEIFLSRISSNLPEKEKKEENTTALYANLQRNGLEIRGSLEKKQENFYAFLPGTFSFSPFSLKIHPSKNLQIDLKFKRDCTNIFRLLIPDHNRLSGRLDCDLSFRGGIYSPKLRGFCRLFEGHYENLYTGSSLRNIEASVSAKKNLLILERLEAKNGEKGEISGSGKMLLDPYKSLPYNFSINLNHAKLLHMEYASTECSGQIKCLGSYKKASISGELSLNNALISIPEKFSPAIPTLNVRFLSEPDDRSPPQNKEKTKDPYPLELDISITSKNGVSVAGKGLRSKWSGNLIVSGTKRSPSIKGALKLDNGTFHFADKTFIVQEGSLNFNDTLENSSLNIGAELILRDIKVKASINGALTSPLVAFASIPSLPLNEIISRILFNRSIGEISPMEMIQIAQIIVDLSEGKSHTGVLGKFKRNIGIDQLTFRNPGEERAAVKIGKYLFHDTLISFEKNIYNEDQQISVETNLSKEFHIQADFGNNTESKMWLKWKRDY